MFDYFVRPVLWSLELASEVFHDFFAYDFGGEERGYRTVRTGIDPSCQRPRKAKNANQISTFRKGEFCKGTRSRLARNLASRKGNLVTKNARSGLNEFATGM